jgi:hypothetical protein
LSIDRSFPYSSLPVGRVLRAEKTHSHDFMELRAVVDLTS